MSNVLVVDYAWQHPTLSWLKANNIHTVGRYLGQGTPPHNLTRAEAALLSDNGIDILVFFEYAAKQALGGKVQAAKDVSLFLQQRDQVGMPHDRPAFFCVDFDLPDFAPQLPEDPAHALTKLGPVGAYFEYIHQHLGAESGGYGGYWLIRRLFEAGLISFGAQTVAWSGGQWDPRACLRQTGQTLLGNELDVDVPERADYGQWKVAKPTPPPPPPPPPAHGPFRHVTDGTQTLGEIAASRGPGLGGLAGLLTLQEKYYTPADVAALEDVKASGVPYYTLHP